MAGATEILGRSLDDRFYYVEVEELKERHDELLRGYEPAEQAQMEEKFDMSWIYHDGALEGQVLSPQEIWTALKTQIRSDSAFQPSLTEVRSHKAAIEHIRSLTDKKKVTIGPELIRRLHNILASGDPQSSGTLVYRKDIPIHRTYFHEITPPNKLAYDRRTGDDVVRDCALEAAIFSPMR